MEFFQPFDFDQGEPRQTWLRSGSNCRAGPRRPGKIFRTERGLAQKASKTGHFSLAWWLHSQWHDGPERIR
jgi:hypothetical protein